MIFIVFINRYAYASSAGDMEYRKQIIKKLKTGKKLIFYKDSQALKKGNKSKNRKAFKENKFVQSIIKAVGQSNKKTINYQQINDNIYKLVSDYIDKGLSNIGNNTIEANLFKELIIEELKSFNTSQNNQPEINSDTQMSQLLKSSDNDILSVSVENNDSGKSSNESSSDSSDLFKIVKNIQRSKSSEQLYDNKNKKPSVKRSSSLNKFKSTNIKKSSDKSKSTYTKYTGLNTTSSSPSSPSSTSS